MTLVEQTAFGDAEQDRLDPLLGQPSDLDVGERGPGVDLDLRAALDQYATVPEQGEPRKRGEEVFVRDEAAGPGNADDQFRSGRMRHGGVSERTDQVAAGDEGGNGESNEQGVARSCHDRQTPVEGMWFPWDDARMVWCADGGFGAWRV
jgi:hypothetical protein